MNTIDILSSDNSNLNKVSLCRAPQQISTRPEGETVILDLDSGIYSGLDKVGTSIWNLLEDPMGFGVLLQKILEEYDVAEEQCTIDMLGFLQEMAENKLITIDVQ